MDLDELNLLFNEQSDNYYIYQNKLYSLFSNHNYQDKKHIQLSLYSTIVFDQYLMINVYYSFKIKENKAIFLNIEFGIEKMMNNSYVDFFKRIDFGSENSRKSYLNQLNKQHIDLEKTVFLKEAIEAQQKSLEQHLEPYQITSPFTSFSDLFYQTVYPFVEQNKKEELEKVLNTKQQFLDKLHFKNSLEDGLIHHIDMIKPKL